MAAKTAQKAKKKPAPRAAIKRPGSGAARKAASSKAPGKTAARPAGARSGSQVEKRMHEIGIVLPAIAPPVANYIPFVRTGKLVFISGQITLENGVPQFLGKLGRDYTIEDGQRAARVCALNVVAQLKAACGGNLDKVKRCVRIGGFVNSTPDFVDQPKVMNGASNLLVEIFGEDGKHARTAVGVNTLPWGVAVEVEALFELR